MSREVVKHVALAMLIGIIADARSVVVSDRGRGQMNRLPDQDPRAPKQGRPRAVGQVGSSSDQLPWLNTGASIDP